MGSSEKTVGSKNKFSPAVIPAKAVPPGRDRVVQGLELPWMPDQVRHDEPPLGLIEQKKLMNRTNLVITKAMFDRFISSADG